MTLKQKLVLQSLVELEKNVLKTEINHRLIWGYASSNLGMTGGPGWTLRWLRELEEQKCCEEKRFPRTYYWASTDIGRKEIFKKENSSENSLDNIKDETIKPRIVHDKDKGTVVMFGSEECDPFSEEKGWICVWLINLINNLTNKISWKMIIIEWIIAAMLAAIILFT
jgi:hypothetical protein